MKLSFRRTGSIGVAFLMAGFVLSSCSKNGSKTTMTAYNDTESGGYEHVDFDEQETPAGTVFIEGGSFVMGRTESDNVNYEWNNEPRKVSVSSFYMDETEVTNDSWCEYLYWLNRTYGSDYPEVYINALPDTNCWRDKLSYNENYVGWYLRYPAYREYPVVGVSWIQANNFCKWRSDRVNENILIREGLFEKNPNQVNDDNFSTDAYLAGQYESAKRKEGVPSYAPDQETRNVKIEDGILLPNYRLPTEAEWEYAALALIGESYEERIENRKIYPWTGNFIRNDNRTGNYLGDIRDNFTRGRGDMMGVAGSLNDGADITAPVYKYFPNDYGLYSMGGNVSEWTMDVYRPLTSEDVTEFRAFRGNRYRTPVLNSEGVKDEKLTAVEYNIDDVQDFIEKFKAALEADAEATAIPIIPAEKDLLDKISTEATAAVKLNNERQRDAANEKIQVDIIEKIKDSETVIAPLLLDGISDNAYNVPGQAKYRDVKIEENTRRTNYKVSDNIDYLDGDLYSSKEFLNKENYKRLESVYNWNNTSLMDTRVRVYKGASWSDRAYYVSPATRRYLDERRSSSKIGFRCVMDRLGEPTQAGAKKRSKK
ncbi:MAG: SUMF1/EgtB/PvdO family nonheme iron enzyme [Bacteroidota bacterium]